MALPSATLARLHEAIHQIYRATSHEEFIGLTISQVRVLAPSDYVSYNELDSRPERILARLWPPEAAQPARLITWSRLAHQSPLLRYYQRTKDGSPRRLSDVISPSGLRELPLWRDLYRSMRVNYQLAFTLPARQPLVIGIAASRTAYDYSDAELAAMALLRPHLIQAHDRTLELDRLRARVNALESALQATGETMILIPTSPSSTTEDIESSQILHRWLSESNPARHDFTEWSRAQRQRLQHGGAHLPSLGEPLVMAGAHGSLIATYVHNINDNHDAVVLREGATLRAHHAARTATALGLTPRQTQVAVLAAGGNTNQRTGQLLGISSATVKKHLENAYTRLGVSNRAELTALLLHTTITAANSANPPHTSPVPIRHGSTPHRGTDAAPEAVGANAPPYRS